LEETEGLPSHNLGQSEQKKWEAARERRVQMKIGVFVSDYTLTVDTLDRMPSDKMGIILVQNGVYHAAVKKEGQASAVLEKAPQVYALREDLETRGYGEDAVDERVKVIGYGDIVDLIFNEFTKTAWL
jgi:sulfur relay protein TusB/DsrH